MKNNANVNEWKQRKIFENGYVFCHIGLNVGKRFFLLNQRVPDYSILTYFLTFIQFVSEVDFF